MSQKITRRDFLAKAGISAAGVAFAKHGFAQEISKRPNILLITADDMNFDSLGVTGCRVPDITPNLDKLASQGIRFEHAHVTLAVCQPSRSVLMTGRYPHRNGAMGFEPINENVPTLQESLHAAGYLNGIMAKVSHLAPRNKFCWDVVVDAAVLSNGRNPELYYKYSKEFFEKAKTEGKPFFMMANSQDPHRPFAGSEAENQRKAELTAKVSRRYKPEEITVPPFLPDNVPGVREEMAQYYTSVHRCDEIVGQVLKALKDSGMEDNTIVFFLSDNGISEPFAKTNVYYTSTATPLIVRWPGKTKPGHVNKDDLVSGIDFTPTVLELVGLRQIEGVDGRSMVPLLKGQKQSGRDKVFTFLNETSARIEYPMRCVRTKDYSYLYNAWSDGKTQFRNEPQGGLAFKSMQEAAKSDKKLAERVKFFLYRTPEEFYDLKADPYELHNRINDQKYKDIIEKMRQEMLQMMISTNDPILERFKKQIEKK